MQACVHPRDPEICFPGQGLGGEGGRGVAEAGAEVEVRVLVVGRPVFGRPLCSEEAGQSPNRMATRLGFLFIHPCFVIPRFVREMTKVKG